MEAAAAILIGFAVFFFTAYVIRSRALKPSEARLQALKPRAELNVTTTSEGTALLRRRSNALVSRALNASVYAQRWASELERADLKLRPSEYFLMRVGFGALATLVVTLLGRSAIAFIVGIALGLVVYMLPAYWVKFRTQRRMKDIDAQLVETVTLMANALRAGFAFSQGIDVAAKRVGPPMSVELGRMLLDVNLGLSMEQALQDMNDRIGSDDVDMVVTAILIQRQSGGNLAEVLDSVIDTMRERERIAGEIKTMTASQRFTGWVLTLWPALLAVGFFAINPEMMSLMWTTGAGLALMAIWIVLNVLGGFSLRRILDIDV